jgi:metal-sulfur cluster biosynthetic enzyme
MTDTVHSTVGSADTQHDHAGHDHAGHDHAGHDHAAHVHGADCADGSAPHDHGSDRAGRAAADLDKVVAAAPAAPDTDPQLIEDIEEALRDVVDPELGINIVDLGLVYDLHVDAENVATIDMTLTSAACPLTEMIEEQVSAALVGEAGLVDDFRINWVWLPPWGPEKITEDGREQMRALGFNI